MVVTEITHPAQIHRSKAPVNFSICFPTFNAVGIVRKVLAALCLQEIKSDFAFEVIIVDNNSSEDMRQVKDDYRDKLDLVYVERRKLESTFSVASARNLANRTAKYEYIVCLDSDVICPPDFLENLYQYLATVDEPIMLTAERVFVVTDDFTDDQILAEGASIYEKFPKCRSRANYYLMRDNRFEPGEIRKNLHTPEADAEDPEHPWAYFYGCNSVYPREVALSVNGYNELYDGYWGYDDIEFAYRMIVQGGCKPVRYDKAWVYHQEPAGENWVPLDGKPAVQKNPRLNKSDNPNWKRICETIPGYAQWKTKYYASLSDLITL